MSIRPIHYTSAKFLNCSVCDSGVTRQQYRDARRLGEIDWWCRDCSTSGADVEHVPNQNPSNPPVDDSEEHVASADEGYTANDGANADNDNDEDVTSAAVETMDADDVDVQMEVEEPSLEDGDIVDEPQLDGSTVTYEVIERGSQRSRHRLVDSQGYSYSIHRRTDDAVHWRCTVRNAHTTCYAMVRQTGDSFVPSTQHCHPGESGLVVRSKTVRQIKDGCKTNPYNSAYTIAESCVSMLPNIPNQRSVQNLGRIGNRYRQNGRPRHPTDLDFELQKDHVPSVFDISDISVGPQRHLVFFSQRQLHVLSRARCWYVDGTFHVVKRPFIQLWSIHAFVRVDNSMKQIPLAFSLMSSRRFKDYSAVITVVLDRMRQAGLTSCVESVVADFEVAVWKAFRRVLPQTDLRGCAFHWGQAVWRKIQELGLQTAYHNDQYFNMFGRQLLALPCLPWACIEGTLDELYSEATTDAQRQLCTYIRATWINSSIWPPSCWSVFMRRIRSNNDVEGWHRRLNVKAAKGHLNMYRLFELLSAEASLVDTQLQLMKESAIIRRQRQSSRTATARLFTIWERLLAKERTVRQTLKAACNIMVTSR